MPVEIRPAENLDEFEQAFMAIGQYFGMDRNRERTDRFAELLRLERMFAGVDGGGIVAGAGGFPFELSVPGGSVKCSGTTVVGVAPTHRRRGVLRSLMRAHIDQVRELGEPLAALWASEETIYGRFGYGQAAYAGTVAVPRDHTEFASPVERRGTLRLVDADEAARTFPPLWDALARERPGVFARTDTWWQYRVFDDPPDRRGGAGPKHFALLELDGGPAAYAVYRHKWSMNDGVVDGKIVVVEAIGSSAQATAELWRYLLDIDWTGSIDTFLVPPDHPLFFVLAKPRLMQYRMGDGLWVRLVDVGAALAARRYAGDEAIVFDVKDEFCPWNEGRWRLEGGTAERTNGEADLALTAQTLGSAYLGGIGFAQLAQAGLVDELRSGAIERADRLFRHALHPWCPEIF